MKIIPFVLTLFAWLPAAAQNIDVSTFQFRIEEIRASHESSQDIRFVAVNNSPATVTLFFGATGSNLYADKDLPLTLIVDPNSSQDIVHVTHTNRWEPLRLNLRYSYQPGNAFMLPDRHARYILPLEKGTPFLVVQGPAGMGVPGTLVTHDNDYSRYAFDLGVSEGTPVTAAREGIVIDAKDSFTVGRPDPSLGNKANYVAVMHEDKSIAYYLHLSPHSVVVNLGQWVYAGDLIAYSGNTGFTYGPHLHFDVRRAAISAKGEVVHMSVPVDFYQRDGAGEKIVLEEGMLIKAP
ncbi:MAG: M23 family metallopeptidase [Betaproteobacteria bacterium]|nr:M23 family metallopeptidase [Betaproteobacteria bacterium]